MHQEMGGGVFGWKRWRRRWGVVRDGWLTFHADSGVDWTSSGREIKASMIDGGAIELDGARVALGAKSATKFCVTPRDTVGSFPINFRACISPLFNMLPIEHAGCFLA